MAYIGQSIKNGTFTDLGFTGTFNSSTTDFNLGTQVGSAAQLLVSKNGVIQRPGTDVLCEIVALKLGLPPFLYAHLSQAKKPVFAPIPVVEVAL